MIFGIIPFVKEHQKLAAFPQALNGMGNIFGENPPFSWFAIRNKIATHLIHGSDPGSAYQNKAKF